MHNTVPIFMMVMLSASAFGVAGIGEFGETSTVAVSFHNDRYDKSIVEETGSQILRELPEFGLIYARASASEITMLTGHPSVDFVEKDNSLTISAAVKATSSRASANEYSGSWGITDISVEHVHEKFTGDGIKIAVLDTGIDYNHPDLAPNYKGGYDFINNDDDPMDDNGHGSHVAGIIAAAKNDKGVIGVAPEAEIYSLKVSDNRGKGSFRGLVEGINWAIENDMDIVTMSITGKGGSRALQKAADDAYNNHGIILVAAVGNGNVKNAEGENVLYPAAYKEVIGVGSVTKDHTKSTFSLTGTEVEMVAPGSSIWSTWVKGEYRSSSGTSMAAPFVTGSIALLLTSDERSWLDNEFTNGDGKWTNEELRKVLRGTSVDLGREGKDNFYGYGLINLQMLQEKDEIIEPTITAVAEKSDVSGKVPHVPFGWLNLYIYHIPN